MPRNPSLFSFCERLLFPFRAAPALPWRSHATGARGFHKPIFPRRDAGAPNCAIVSVTTSTPTWTGHTVGETTGRQSTQRSTLVYGQAPIPLVSCRTPGRIRYCGPKFPTFFWWTYNQSIFVFSRPCILAYLQYQPHRAKTTVVFFNSREQASRRKRGSPI